MSAPYPPSDLGRRMPETVTLLAGTVVHRFYSAGFEPIYFDRSTQGRLNAPNGSYGVLYVARDPEGAFAETFLRRPGLTLLESELLARKGYVRIAVSVPMRLIRLAGPGLAILGATAEVVHGGLPYTVPQAWSAALAAHPLGADGIAYYARHDDEALCYALFDRCEHGLTIAGEVKDLDQDWFWRIAAKYKVGLAP